MDKKLDTLYDLCDIVFEELEVAKDKIHDGISSGDMEFLDKLTHIYKSLQTSIAMIESEHHTKRSHNEGFVKEIEEAIEKAPDEHTRRKLERMLADMK